MIAQFLEHADGFERLASLSAKKSFDIRALDKVVVEVHLERSEVAEHHMLVFDRKVFGEDIIGTANNEFIDQG